MLVLVANRLRAKSRVDSLNLVVEPSRPEVDAHDGIDYVRVLTEGKKPESPLSYMENGGSYFKGKVLGWCTVGR